eukprot:46989_1
MTFSDSMTLAVAIIASTVAIINSALAGYIVYYFLIEKKQLKSVTQLAELSLENKRSQSTVAVPTKIKSSTPKTNTPTSPKSTTQSSNPPTPTKSTIIIKTPETVETVRPQPIFRYLASSIAIFSALNAIFNSVYCIWLVLVPQNSNQFYVDHPAHTHRVTSTVCWYCAKVLFVWLLSFRLLYAFKGSAFYVNKKFIACLNIANSIIAPFGLFTAYWAVYTKQHSWIAEFSFNFWRLLYQIIVFVILYMFCRR